MKLEDHGGIEAIHEKNRRDEVMEMHPVNRRAGNEGPLCGAQASDDERFDVEDYLEGRKDGNDVGTVCEACKPLAIPFAVKLVWDLEAEGRPDESEEYRQLAETLARETGQNPPFR